MPSKIPNFCFRNGKLRLKLTKSLKIDEAKLNRFAALATEHLTDYLHGEICPICKKPLDQCEYFKRIDEE